MIRTTFPEFKVDAILTSDCYPKRNTERWKEIKGYTDYHISNMGRVKSFKNGKEVILKQGINQKGYAFVNLFRRAKQTGKRIHSLVITHFGLPKPSSKHECNHIDADKSNNWWTNLEWLTHKQNVNHAVEMGLWYSTAGESNGKSKLTNDQVIQIRKLYKSGNYTYLEISLAYKVSHAAIYKIVNKMSWKYI